MKEYTNYLQATELEWNHLIQWRDLDRLPWTEGMEGWLVVPFPCSFFVSEQMGRSTTKRIYLLNPSISSVVLHSIQHWWSSQMRFRFGLESYGKMRNWIYSCVTLPIFGSNTRSSSRFHSTNNEGRSIRVFSWSSSFSSDGISLSPVPGTMPTSIPTRSYGIYRLIKRERMYLLRYKLFVKGAPEELITKCFNIATKNGDRTMGERDLANFKVTPHLPLFFCRHEISKSNVPSQTHWFVDILFNVVYSSLIISSSEIEVEVASDLPLSNSKRRQAR